MASIQLAHFFYRIYPHCDLAWLECAASKKKGWCGEIYFNQQRGFSSHYYGPPLRPWKSLPVMWRLLGTKPVTSISLKYVRLQDGDREQIRASFPEAEITE
jgi:hypothetical protein